jgi:hypothetical protein
MEGIPSWVATLLVSSTVLIADVDRNDAADLP